MAKDESPKSNEALELVDQQFIKEFSGIDKRNALELYEQANQKRIMESSVYVRDAFDKRWKAVTSHPYFSPITIRMPKPDGSGVVFNPKSSNYRVKRRFSSIRWHKIVHEIPTKADRVRRVTMYDLYGTIQNGEEITIEKNLAPNMLPVILTEELARKITNKPAKEVDGTIDNLDEEIAVIGYWEVEFSPASSQNDSIDVVLSHNGVCLQLQRQKRVILPGFYLEVADNGMFPKYVQTPEQSRKLVGWIKFFPYSVFREATEAEYLIQKREGDRLTKEARRLETELT